MQVSELEALATGSRIRVTLDDRPHQTWVKHDNGSFSYNSLFATAATFTAPLAADRVQVITKDDMTWADLPKFRFTEDWLDVPTRSTWARALRGEVFGGVTPEMRTSLDGYDETYVCFVRQERHASFREVTAPLARQYGIPGGLIGCWFRFFRSTHVEQLTGQEALLWSLPLLRISREPTVAMHGEYQRSWFGDEEIVEFRCAPVRNAGSYTHFMVAPEGVDTGGFIVEAEHCGTYEVPADLVGMRGQWVRDTQIAPSEEEIAEREAAQARQTEWFNSQPQYRVHNTRISRAFHNTGLTVMHLPNVGSSRNEDWVGILPIEGQTCRDVGLWDVTVQRQAEFHLPLETVGMWGYWVPARFLTLVDPVAEWLESLPKRSYTTEGTDPPSGDYMDTRPPVAYVDTGRGDGTGGLFFGGRDTFDGLDWGFWDDGDMRPFIPEHLRDHLGNDLFGYWVNPEYTERVLTPDEQETEVLARITDAVGEVEQRMQRLIDGAHAETDRMRRHLERVSASLREVLDDHDYDYGCGHDDTLEEAGYPRERPTETIWVEVKVTGESYYEVPDSDIEAHFDNNLATESSSYTVCFNWEREERVEDVTVEQSVCVCGNDPEETINVEALRRRLRDLDLPDVSGVDFEIVNCENG
jgi:hypothetical protein